MRFNRWFVIPVFLFSLPLPVAGQQAVVEITRAAPYFILPTHDGNTLRSTSLKGKVVVLDFFQTWCPDCQKSSAELEKLYKKYRDQGLIVVAISHDKEKSLVVEPYVKKYGLTHPVLIGDISIAVNYLGITAQKPKFNIPYIVLIDRAGNIAGQFEEGQRPEATDVQLLEERIKQLL